MKKTFPLLLSISLMSVSLIAAPLYTLDTTQDKTGDFRKGQIGSDFGTNNTNSFLNYNTGDDTYELSARYGGERAMILTVPLDTPVPGAAPAGYVDGDVSTSLSFTYYNNASNSDVVLSLRQDAGNYTSTPGYNYNTYPNYFIRLQNNATFTLNKFIGYQNITNMDSATLTGLNGSADYQIIFSAINNGTDVDLSAEIFEDGVSKGTLSSTDTSPLSGGYIGIAGGQGSTNNGTIEGIKISGFQVADTVIAIPEPSSFVYILTSALVGISFLRKRQG